MSAALPGPCDAAAAHATQSQPTAHLRATLAACILGSSLAFVDGSVVNVALPVLDRDLHGGAQGTAWIVSAYLLTLSSLILLGGALGDHYGRRRVFLIGVGVFLVASLGCATAPDLRVLLASRLLQGAGAALLMPNSLAILGSAFSGEAKGRAIGTWAGVGALAGALGPLLGGWLVSVVGWRPIFLINLPIGAASAWLTLRYVQESHEKEVGARLDAVGAGLATVSLGVLTWALTAAGEPGGDRARLAIATAGGVILLGVFVRRELRLKEKALMPLFLMRDPSFVGVTLLTFLLYAALGGLTVLLPFVLIRAEGYSPVAAGAALLPIPIAVGLGSRLTGALAARSGDRLPLATGAFFVAAGLALYVRIGDDGSYWTEVLPATVLVAIGMSASVAPLTSAVMASVDADHVGAASGFNSAVARVGGLIATALLGFVFAEQAKPALVASAHLAALAGGISAAIGGVCALLLIRRGRGKSTPEQPST